MRVLDHFDDERVGALERNLSEWFKRLVHAVQTKYFYFFQEKKLAMKGSLAYTDPGTGRADHDSGYYGYADYVFPSGSSLFCGVELKLTRLQSLPLWYQLRAVLAQVICWLGGTREMQVGLILTNVGFKLLFRREIARENGVPVFEYFHCCFDGESDYHLNQMRGKAGRVNRERFMRIVYEIVKVSTMTSQKADSADVPTDPLPTSGRMTDSEPSNEDSEDDKQAARRRSERLKNRENRDAGGGNNAVQQRPAFNEVKSSYEFKVKLSDGSMMSFVGLELCDETA